MLQSKGITFNKIYLYPLSGGLGPENATNCCPINPSCYIALSPCWGRWSCLHGQYWSAKHPLLRRHTWGWDGRRLCRLWCLTELLLRHRRQWPKRLSERGRRKKKCPARLYGKALRGGWRSLGVDDREKVGHCCLLFCRYVWDLLEWIRARFTRLSSCAKNPQPHQTIVVVQNTQKEKDPQRVATTKQIAFSTC